MWFNPWTSLSIKYLLNSSYAFPEMGENILEAHNFLARWYTLHVRPSLVKKSWASFTSSYSLERENVIIVIHSSNKFNSIV